MPDNDLKELISPPTSNTRIEQNDVQALWEMIGQMKAHNLTGRFCHVLMVRLLASIKEGKAYKPISGTWDAFCRGIGISRAHADEWITNYHVLGQQLLQAAEKLTLPVRTLRAMRALPPEARPLVDEDCIVFGAGDEERRISIEGGNQQEIQLEIEKLQQSVDETRRVSEKTSRDLGREKTALNKQVDELLDRCEKLERSGAGEQLPDEAAELLKSSLDLSLRSLHAFRQIDLDTLSRAPDAVGQAWQALTINERLCSDLRLILGRKMEEWDIEPEEDEG